MTYKLSTDVTEAFKAQDEKLMVLGTLDIRLGLEQIQDDLTFRPEATAYWLDNDVEFSDESFLPFENVSARHKVGIDAIRAGMSAIINRDDFKSSCEERWAARDANPWPGDPNANVDLAAMPDGPLTA